MVKVWSLSALLIICIQSVSFGQIGCFNFVTDTIGCVPFYVKAVNCFTPGQLVAYNYNLGNTPNAWLNADLRNQGNDSTTYTLPGYYIFAQAASGNFSDPLKRVVHVYEQNVKPQYSLNFCLGNLSINLPDTIFKNYEVVVAGVPYPRGSGNTVRIPIAFGPGETRKAVPFTVRGIMSLNCGDNSLQDTAIIYNSVPVFNIDSVVERLSGDVSTFAIQATVPAVSRIRLRIRDTGFALDTVVITDIRDETLQYSKSYAGAKQPTFSISIAENCPTNINLKDSLIGVLTRLGTSGSGLKVDLPQISDPYDAVKAKLNDSVITAIPTPYLADIYEFEGITGCRKNNCLTIWYTDFDGGRPSVFHPAKSCTLLSQGQGLTAVLSSSVVDGRTQFLTVDNTLPLALAMLGNDTLAIEQTPQGKRITAPYTSEICYPIVLQDSCQNIISPLGGLCAMRLRTRKLDHLSVTLVWSRPRPVSSAINLFKLIAMDNSGNILNSIETTDTVFTDRSNYTVQPVRYVVQGIPDDSARNGLSISEIVPVVREEKVVLPSAFSPNGDGSNDSLAAYVFNLKAYSFRITNRWGEIVYSKEYNATDFNSPKNRLTWDGNFKGRPVQSGSYFATVHGKTYSNEKFSATQMVQVVQ